MNNGFLAYLPNGSKTNDLSEFIREYSKKYMDYIQNSEEKEQRIKSIVNKGIDMSTDDVVFLMRWKLNDNRTEGDLYNCYGKKIPANFSTKVISAVKSLDNTTNSIEIYRKLLDLHISGFGTVYLLTLVWAFSKMYYPIYDKYADIAIRAIYGRKKPCEIQYMYPPDKYQIEKIEKMYNDYQEKLSLVFGDEWKKNRGIDQALWAYGHLKLN